ncbi:MAG: OB-fold-containig protein [Myxococcota bacterium]
MLNFILDGANLPFSIAIALMMAIAALEVLTLAFGAAASGIVDSLLPDFDFDLDVDLDVDSDVDAPDMAAHVPALSVLMSWLHVGKVPTLILFAAFLFGFGLSGYTFQGVVDGIFGRPLTPWLAAVPAFFGSLPVIHVVGRTLRFVLPSEETDAVSRTSFIGRTAVITLGTAQKGEPAQARLKDEKGQTHYVMVEPRDSGALESGSEVVLVGLEGVTFAAVSSDMPQLES